MTLAQLVNETYLAYRGKLSNVPAVGSEKYNRILTIVNRNLRQWAQDSTVDWPSRYTVRTVGTTVSGSQSYNLDDDIMRPANYVQLINSSGQVQYKTLVKPQTISGQVTGAYISGADSKQLTFITKIDTSLAGLTINLPCYVLPDPLVNSNDTVVIDNPQWLIYATAAELARNDYSKEEQYTNLQGIANDLYANMKSDAEVNAYSQPNGIPNNMPQFQSLDF